MTRLDRLSDSQANAEALARRTSTYADEHAASWQVRFDRPTHEPVTLREYANQLRREYELEPPAKLHEGPDDIDGGGTPRLSAEFAHWLFGQPGDVDEPIRRGENDDPAVLLGFYRTPVRAALGVMVLSPDVRRQHYAYIARRMVAWGFDHEAATAPEGIPAWASKTVAKDALRALWLTKCDIRMHLPKREAVA